MTARMSPVVRRLVEARRLDPAVIVGTGEDGRITRRDVYAATQDRPDAPAPSPPAAPVPNAPVTAAVSVDFEQVERAVPAMAPVSRAAARLAVVTRAVCDTIAAFPYVNAYRMGDALAVHASAHVRIVLELEDARARTGIIRDAHTKTLATLAREVRALVDGEHNGAAEASDATFTIRQSDAAGGQVIAPVLEGPQVAMVTVGAITTQVVIAQGPDGYDAIAIRPVGAVAVTWDHCVFDGAYGSAFIDAVRTRLEASDWVAELASAKNGQ